MTFQAGSIVRAPDLQALGDGGEFTPVIRAGAAGNLVDFGAGAQSVGRYWINGNRVSGWFWIRLGSGPGLAAGNWWLEPLPGMPIEANTPIWTPAGQARLDVGSPSYTFFETSGDRFVMRDKDGALTDSDTPGLWTEGHRLGGSFSYITGAAGAVAEEPGSVGPHVVTFRDHGVPANQTPSATPTASEIEHVNGGTIYAGGAGTTRQVFNKADWDAAVAAAVPGDIIKIMTTISGQTLTYRGSKYGLAGANGASGTAGNPIVITGAGGAWIDRGDLHNNAVGLDIRNVDHVWVIDVNIRNAQFGARFQNWAGTASDPVRVAHCIIQDCGHNNLAVQGWWQAIASSGGTPPAGAGNEWGFSEHFLVEKNIVQRPGRTDTEFGECIYLGYGGSPGWISHAKDGIVRYNYIEDWAADGIDCKPGCHRIDILDNVLNIGRSHFGACIGLCYVASLINDRPAWFNFDPEIYCEGNRVRDFNITRTTGATAPWPIYLGLSGIRIGFNTIWSWQDGSGGTTSHAVRLRIEKPIAQFGTDPTHVVNNTFWSGNGFENVGDNSFTPAPGVVVRNNIVATGKSGGTHTASASDFIDPGQIPAIGTVGQAQWNNYGSGSAFDLDPNSALHGAGTSITDLTFRKGEDISQRALQDPPSPGAFMQHPANL